MNFHHTLTSDSEPAMKIDTMRNEYVRLSVGSYTIQLTPDEADAVAAGLGAFAETLRANQKYAVTDSKPGAGGNVAPSDGSCVKPRIDAKGAESFRIGGEGTKAVAGVTVLSASSMTIDDLAMALRAREADAMS